MSVADPDDDGRTADSAGRAATFEEIVAGWRAEGAVPRWPDERIAGAAGDEGHYVPPDPPPMPRLGRSALVGITLLGVGLVLLVSPGVLAISESAGLPLGLLALAGGLGWLVLRSWPAVPPTDGDGGDDGAVL